MGSIDKAAIVFSIAIALVGVGIAAAGNSADNTPTATPFVSTQISEQKSLEEKTESASLQDRQAEAEMAAEAEAAAEMAAAEMAAAEMAAEMAAAEAAAEMAAAEAAAEMAAEAEKAADMAAAEAAAEMAAAEKAADMAAAEKAAAEKAAAEEAAAEAAAEKAAAEAAAEEAAAEKAAAEAAAEKAAAEAAAEKAAAEAAAAAPKTVIVDIPVGTSVPGCETTNECFTPASISINAGDTVEWANVDTAAHTVTGGSPADGPSGVFDSSLLMASGNYSFTFDEAGSYDYFCMVHPWMVGDVSVN